MRKAGRTRLMLLMMACAAPLAAGAGCTPWATYPHEPGTVDKSRANVAPIPELMARAVKHVYESEGGAEGGEMVFNLPAGTPESVYSRVLSHLQHFGPARPMQDPSEKAIHVVQVRVRTYESEVDVIHHKPSGEPEEMTLFFRQDILQGQRFVRARSWNYATTPPPPSYQQLEPPQVEPSPVPESADADVAGAESPG